MLWDMPHTEGLHFWRLGLKFRKDVFLIIVVQMTMHLDRRFGRNSYVFLDVFAGDVTLTRPCRGGSYNSIYT